MRKPWLIGAGVALIGTAAAAYLLTHSRREWTTDSPAALAAYLEGREAQAKIYSADAARAYARAIELDPGFAAARVGLIEAEMDKEQRAAQVEELRRADLSRLTDRERLMVESFLATEDGDFARRRAVVDAYLAEHPGDPMSLRLAAGDAWNRRDWPAAQAGYEKLLEADPKWIVARNNLGYIAMARGDFAEAEEQFRIYRFVAPDQANPHDSLGELLVLVGRFDEARQELEQALAIRPDFCASYQNLMNLAVFDRRPEDLPELAQRATAHCEPMAAARARCAAVLGRALLTGDFDLPWEDEGRAACGSELEEPDVLVHQLAVLSGRGDLARDLEAKLAAQLAEPPEKTGTGAAPEPTRASYLWVLEGQRLLIEGRAAAAAERFRQADEVTTFWAGNGGGVVKLLAELLLAESLEAAGDHAGAEKALARLRDVNPSIAGWFGTGPWRRFAAADAAPPG